LAVKKNDEDQHDMELVDITMVLIDKNSNRVIAIIHGALDATELNSLNSFINLNHMRACKWDINIID